MARRKSRFVSGGGGQQLSINPRRAIPSFSGGGGRSGGKPDEDLAGMAKILENFFGGKFPANKKFLETFAAEKAKERVQGVPQTIPEQDTILRQKEVVQPKDLFGMINKASIDAGRGPAPPGLLKALTQQKVSSGLGKKVVSETVFTAPELRTDVGGARATQQAQNQLLLNLSKQLQEKRLFKADSFVPFSPEGKLIADDNALAEAGIEEEDFRRQAIRRQLRLKGLPIAPTEDFRNFVLSGGGIDDLEGFAKHLNKKNNDNKINTLLDIRQAYRQDKKIRDFEIIDAQFKRAIASVKGLEGEDFNFTDQALGVIFQRILDPTSVVRESEFARSTAGQALLRKLETFRDKIKEGALFSPDSRRDLFSIISRFYEAAREDYDRSITGYTKLAEFADVEPKLAFTSVPKIDTIQQINELNFRSRPARTSNPADQKPIKIDSKADKFVEKIRNIKKAFTR